MDDNVLLIITKLAQYLLIPAFIGAILGFELARSNGLRRWKTAVRGGSVGLVCGLFVVTMVTTFVGYF